MKRHQRGAARVSLVWLIAFSVMIIALLFMVFVAYSDKAKADEALQDALAQAQVADERQAAAASGWTSLSEAVGWYDPQAATPRTDVKALRTSLESLAATFPDLGEDVDGLATALPVVEAAYKARSREVQQLRDDLARLDAEKKALEQSLREASGQKDTQIADLNRQIQDEAENAVQKQSELEARVENLRQQSSELDAEVRTLRAELEDTARRHEEERQLWTARVNEMKESLQLPREPERPDGSVLQVAADGRSGWIDLGRRNRLAPGMRFEVIDADRPGRQKGWATVSDVQTDMARVELQANDRFDPIVQGDQLFNPVFDPRSERDAVLVGRFSGRYNERELTALLAGIGIRVQPQLDLTTDYLIVGSELYTDEEGEPYEDPVRPSDLPIYKNAEASGVEIIPLKDLYAYFKY